MSFEILKKELKNKIIRNIYLFYGPEEYLLKYYLNNIKEQCITPGLADLNFSQFEEGNASVASIMEFCESLPVMSDKKLIIIKKANFLKAKKSDSSSVKSLVDYLETLPEYAHIIFVEGEEIDKRSSLFNYVSGKGLVVEFQYQPKNQLIKWVEKIFKENGIIIGQGEAGYLIENLDDDMQTILNETLKLIGYCRDKKEVAKSDIDIVCTKSLSSKVFEMIDSIAQKEPDEALSKLSDMISLKEPVLKILVLLAKHIKTLLQVKSAQNEGISSNIISQRLKINYVVKYIKQSENFTLERLEKALMECSNADVLIKSSSVDERIILEKLIVQIAG